MRRKSSSSKSIFFALLAATFCSLTILFLKQPIQIDTRYGCPKESQHIGTSMSILLDATEPYGIAQVKHVARLIFDRVELLNAHDRIKVYTVDDTSISGLRPIFHLCVPDPKSNEMPLFRRLQDARFKQFLEDALSMLQDNRPQSNIISSLSWVASDFERDASAKMIILVSDLIENSDNLSMYDPNWLSEINDHRINAMRPMLTDIALELVVLARPNQEIQNKELLQWWFGFLTASGGFIDRSITVSG